MTARRTLRRAREELGKLEAFAGLLSSARRDDGPDVIELEEVSPGVFAAPSARRGRSVFGTLGALVDQVDELDTRARALAKEKPWRSRP